MQAWAESAATRVHSSVLESLVRMDIVAESEGGRSEEVVGAHVVAGA